MKKMTIGKRIFVVLLAIAITLTGMIPGGFSLQNAKAADASVIYFEYADGTKQYLDDNDTITLKTTDKGTFKCGNSTFKGWQCTYRVPGVTHVLINKETGEFSYNDAITVPYTFKRAEAFDTNYDTIQYFNVTIEAGDTAPDKTALEAAISEVEEKLEDDYSEDSWNTLQTALKAAKEVQSKEDCTQDEIDTATTNLKNAISGLQENTVKQYVYFEYADGTRSKRIVAGETLTLKLTDQGTFRLYGNKGGDAHWNGCMNMDTGAFISLGKVKTSDCTVNAGDWSFRIKFTVRITTDTDALKSAIAEAEVIEKAGKSDYTDKSWSAFGTALVNARVMLEDADTDGTEQANINNAANNLTAAIKGLKKVGELDKDTLQEAIKSAEAKDENDYTAASWKVMQDALTAAKAADAKADVKQDEVDQAAATLQNAVTALVKKTNKTALDKAIQTAESKQQSDYTADTWSSLESALKEAKEVSANEEATQDQADTAAKKLNDAISALKEVEKAVVYFEYSDGTKKYLDEDNTIKLKSTDNGTFKVEDTTGVYWNCDSKVKVTDPNTGNVNTKTHYWIKYGTGAFDGSAGAIDKVTATVEDASGKTLKTFTLSVEVEKYAELKAYVGDTEVTAENPYHVNGTDKVSVTIKGRKEGEETFNWIDPAQLTVQETDTNAGRYDRVNRTYCVLAGSTQATFNVSLTADSNVSTKFTLYSDPVALTDFSIKMPSVFYIDAWNGLAGDQYVGITSGNGDNNYIVSYAPYNTNEQQLTWKSLTPEIAEYSDEAFSNGIVPKKAGVAKFEVSSVKHPEIKHEVSVEFRYKTPLTAVNTNATMTMEAGSSQSLEMSVVPNDATEQRFHWTYSEDGIVEVKDSIYQDPSSVLIPKQTSHSIKALKAGIVTVTGTPYDQTGNCEPVVFTVKVTDNSQSGEITDANKIVTNGIQNAAFFLNSQGYKYECNATSDWYVMSKLRSGQNVSEANKAKYYQSAAETVKGWTAEQAPTDIERVALTLSAMGKDITDVDGVNLAAMIYNHEKLGDYSNGLIWGLLTLDASKQEIPADAKWSRESMIDALLTFQNQENGGFCWVGTSWTDVDMTAMAVQALAPYVKDAKVNASVEKALAFMKDNMAADYSYTSAETAAQVILALASLKLDPVKAGFATEDNGVIQALEKNYAVADGGYSHVKNGAVNAMATYQTLEAYEAYRRYAAAEDSYWDMSALYPCKHEKLETIPAKEATCTETGLTEGKKCAKCGTIVEEQKVIPAKGHKFGKWTTTVAPTTSKKGVQTRKCSSCGYTEKRELAKLPATTTAIKVNSKKVTIKEKKGFQIKAVVTPKGSKDGIIYRTSNKKVATVSKKGYIKGVKAGKATIR